jgi:hypothetical protein
MPNINRTDDLSQQQEILSISSFSPVGTSAIPTGSTLYCGNIVPRSMTIQSIQHTCFGISGAPQALLGCLRFANSTSFVIGSTALIPSYGVSGYMSYSLQGGTTALQLQKGDVLVLQQLGGSSAATTGVVMNIVVKNIQDIKTWY